MKVYAISGLGADKRVFQYLNLNCELIPIEWIKPEKGESIESYSLRLSKNIDTSEKFGILGVSFGGLVAVEMSKNLNPKLTILISSVEQRNELRSIYRIFGKLSLAKLIPKKLFDPPRFIANWLFKTKEKELLNQILNDTDLSFTKWAVNELINWENTTKLKNRTLKIEGSHDKLIPPQKGANSYLIANGEHLMIVDRASEISAIINEEIKKH